MHLQDKGAQFESGQSTAKQSQEFRSAFSRQLTRWLSQSPKPEETQEEPKKVRSAESPAAVTSNELQLVKAHETHCTRLSAPIDAHQYSLQLNY